MKITNEAKIGMMVSVVVIFLGILTLKTGNFNVGEEGYLVKARFKRIDGVTTNSPVMLNGFEVGLVKEILISYDGDETVMELAIWLKEEARLREGAKAFVKNMGFMGEKYVGLSAGNAGGAFLGAGAVLEGQQPPDLEELLADGQVIAANIKEVSINLNERLTKNKEAIDQIAANLDTAMKNAVSITNNVDERLKVNQGNIDQTLTNLKAASVNLEELTYDLKTHPWKLMYKTKEKGRKNKTEEPAETPLESPK